MRRRVRQLTTNIGQLYVDLAEALMEQRRFAEAIDAYRRALAENEEVSDWRERVHSSLAESAAHAAREDLAVRGSALRVALDAALIAPETLLPTVRLALKLAGPEFLDEHARWVTETWHRAASELPLNAGEKTYSGLLKARCALYVGSYRLAVEQLRELREDSPSTIPKLTADLLRDPLIPDSVSTAGLADTHWAVAQALEAGGDESRALREVDEALSAGFEPTSEFVLAALSLRSDLLARRSERTEAGAARVALGRALQQRGRIPDAIEAYRQATQDDDTAAEPWWYLADALRSSALLDGSPYFDVAAVEDARSALEQGFSRRLPKGAGDSWAYCVLSLVRESVSLVTRDSSDGPWDALLAAEQAVALDPESADAWALCSRYSRMLGLYASAAGSCERALELDGANTLAAQEWVTIHSEADRPEAALAVIDQFRSVLGDADRSLDACSGYLLLLAGRDDEALERLNASIATGGDEPFRRLFRGIATLFCNGAGAAAQDFQWVGDHTEAPTAYYAERSWALWLLGNYDEAERGFAVVARWPGLDSAVGRAGLAACAAARSDFDPAERLLAEAINVLPESAAAMGLLIRLLEDQVQDPRVQPMADRTRRTIAKATAARSGIDASPTAAAAECDKASQRSERGSVAWIAASANRGRWAVERTDWEQALTIYDEIEAVDTETTFPERRALQTRCLHAIDEHAQRMGDVATVQAIQERLAGMAESAPWEQAVAIASAQRQAGWTEDATETLVALLDTADSASSDPRASQAIADSLLRVGRFGDAKRALDAGLASAPDGTAQRGRIEARLGVLAATQDDLLDARQWLLHAVRSTAAEKGDAKVGRVVGWCEKLVDENTRPQLNAVLRLLLEDPRLTSAHREELAARHLRASRQRRGDLARLRPVSPVVLSLDARLLDGGSDSALAERLTNEVCPMIRDQLQDRAGIRLPGVRLQKHANESGDKGYTILVREIPVRIGRIEDREERPLDDEALGDRLGSELQEVLRPRLAEFVGFSEVGMELLDWAARGGPGRRVAILERALPNRTARAAFSRTVHRLVEEQVPVDHLGTLLTAFAEAREGQLSRIETTEHLRAAVARRLEPGRFDRHVSELDAAIEERIARNVTSVGATSSLAIPSDEIAEILDGIDRQLDGAEPSSVAIAVGRAELRPFVQRLVDSHWRGVVVISPAERDALLAGRSSLATAVTAS